MKIDLTHTDIDVTAKAVIDLPGQFKRARKSALSSTGWFVRGHVRNHVEYGGSGWPGLHPMTQKFWVKRIKDRGGKRNHWFGRRRFYNHNTPLAWLGKFARYRVDRNGEMVQIDFGKSRKGEPGRFDPQLIGIVKRAEYGEVIRVTETMRKFFGATRRKRPKNQIPGQTYFPLKKSTKTLTIPKRPIFGPVFRSLQGKIPGYFEAKFFGALERYWNKGAKA